MSRIRYCDHPASDPCGEASPIGVGRERPLGPDACGTETGIVCGCDGRSYESECGALRHGIETRSAGGCPGLTTYPCGDGHRCNLGTEYCEAETYMSGETTFDTAFGCNQLPSMCPPGETPTCAGCFPGSAACTEVSPPGALVLRTGL